MSKLKLILQVCVIVLSATIEVIFAMEKGRH